MKSSSPALHTILTCILLLIVVGLGQPGFSARAATATPAPVKAESTPACNPARTVQVTGSAAINVAPDRALIQLGVQSNGRTPKEAQDLNTAAIRRVVKSIQSLGVESKDLVTDRYVIEPLYEDYASLNINGYRVYNTVAVTLRDVDKAGPVLAAALQAGANQVVNVEFYTSELRKYRDQARALAVKAAREKADLLAESAGAQTNCVLGLSENIWSSYSGSWGYGRNNNLWTQNVVQNAVPSGNEGGMLSESGPVSLGLISIRAEINASFSLK